MNWNWQQPDWPVFRWDAERLRTSEAAFLKQGGMLLGACRHLAVDDGEALLAETALSEAMTTSSIEGEILDRQSLRSSIMRHLGLETKQRRIGMREDGIARLTLDVFRGGTQGLSHERLWEWHRWLMQDRADTSQVGAYRTQEEPMRIVSGRFGGETTHFEAPPSSTVPTEMDRFLAWFARREKALSAIARSGIAHLYFESIHPFDDGNGRIGRAIADVALAQGVGGPSLTMLSTEIESRRREYYAQLERSSRTLEVTGWLEWYAETVLAAQQRTQAWVDFLIAKTRMMDGLRGRINERQEKALLRVFREGPNGFAGGLSSGNYQTVTGASPASAGRDLTELVELGALSKTGQGKGTRYWLRT